MPRAAHMRDEPEMRYTARYMLYCKIAGQDRGTVCSRKARLIEHGQTSFEHTSLSVKDVRKTFYHREATPLSYSKGATLWMF